MPMIVLKDFILEKTNSDIKEMYVCEIPFSYLKKQSQFPTLSGIRLSLCELSFVISSQIFGKRKSQFLILVVTSVPYRLEELIVKICGYRVFPLL